MSIYSQVLKQFEQKFSLSQFQKLDRQKLSKNLDNLAKINHNCDQFDPILKEQIFNIAPVTYDKKIILKDFATTIHKIFDIITKYIAEVQKNIGSQTDEEDIAVHKQNIRQFTAGRDYLCHVFRLPLRSQSKILIKINKLQESQFQQSQTLKAAFIILIMAMMLEGVVGLSRFGFMNSLVYALALAVFILNFFDKSYIRVCILAFVVSFVFDLLWCLKNSNFYLNSAVSDFDWKFGSLVTIKIISLRFSYLASIILMICKLILAAIFMRFRNTSIYTKKIVRLLDTKFYLQSKPFASPISKLILKNHTQQEVQNL